MKFVGLFSLFLCAFVFAEDRTQDLIRTLGDENWEKRKEAATLLLKEGERSVDALFEATSDEDLEVSHRARQILGAVLTSNDLDTFDRVWSKIAEKKNESGKTGELARELLKGLDGKRKLFLEDVLAKGGAIVSSTLLRDGKRQLTITINTEFDGEMRALNELIAYGVYRISVRERVVDKGLVDVLSKVSYPMNLSLRGAGLRFEDVKELFEKPNFISMSYKENGFGLSRYRSGASSFDTVEVSKKFEGNFEDIFTPLTKTLRVQGYTLSKSDIETIKKQKNLKTLYLVGAGTEANALDRLFNTHKIRVTKTPGGFLGIKSKSYAYGSTTVDEVLKGSPAEKIGFRAGDKIKKINGAPYTTASSIQRKIISTTPGMSLNITILRDGKLITLRPVLGVVDGEDATASFR